MSPVPKKNLESSLSEMARLAITPNRRGATERSGNSSTGSEDRDQAFDGCPGSHAGASKTAQQVGKGGNRKIPALEETTHHALHAAVMLNRSARHRVKTFTLEGGTLVDEVTEIDKCGEGVGEVETEEAANEGDNSVQIGHGGGKDESDDPVRRPKDEPHHAALLGGNVGEVEDFLEDFNVDGLHANVEVEHCVWNVRACAGDSTSRQRLTASNQSRQKGEHIGYRS